MYSRNNKTTLPPHKPPHYDGWAFQTPPEPPVKRQNEEAQRSAPPEIHQSYPRPLPFLPPPEIAAQPQKEDDKRPQPPFVPSMADWFGKSGLLRSLNLDFEEILIIGLIVLLGSNGSDSELPLLLALLLLC